MTTRADRIMLAQPVSSWTFEFWKRQIQEAPDIPAAIGRLGAHSDLDRKYREDVVLFLMALAGYDGNEPREKALAGKARQVLPWSLQLICPHIDGAKYLSRPLLEKALWLYRPKKSLDGLVHPFIGGSEECKTVRRILNNICWKVWEGVARNAVLSHKIQVLRIFYAADRLYELLPPGNIAAVTSFEWWLLFEDVIPQLEWLAQREVRANKDVLGTIEEAAAYGTSACRVLILLRAVLPATHAYCARHKLSCITK